MYLAEFIFVTAFSSVSTRSLLSTPSEESPEVISTIRKKCLDKHNMDLEELENTFLPFKSASARNYWGVLICLDENLRDLHEKSQIVLPAIEPAAFVLADSEHTPDRNNRIRKECMRSTKFDYKNFSLRRYGKYIKCIAAKLDVIGSDGKMDFHAITKFITHDKLLVEKACKINHLAEGSNERNLALYKCVSNKMSEMKDNEKGSKIVIKAVKY